VPGYSVRKEGDSMYRTTGYGSLFGSGLFGSTSSIYSNLGQYNSVRAGAYAKATRAYYSKTAQNNTQTSKKNSSADRYDRTKRYDSTSGYDRAYGTSKYGSYNGSMSLAGTEAKELVDSADKLMDKGKDGILSDKKEYDSDAAYKAVKEFVTNYNDTISAADTSYDSKIRNAGTSMVRMTNVMSKSLEKVGITVDAKGKMSVDEETFKNADQSTVRSLFNSTGSYAGIISTTASRVVTQSAQNTSVYNSIYGSNNSGSYAGNYSRYGSYNYGSNYGNYFGNSYGNYGRNGSYKSYGYNGYYSGNYYNGFF
jgi:hypothetical protein